jgi:acyl carrier protein
MKEGPHMHGIREKVLEAISRVSRRPAETLDGSLNLREDLRLDSLNLLELEYELQQGGFPEIEIEELAAAATIAEVIEFLKSK